MKYSQGETIWTMEGDGKNRNSLTDWTGRVKFRKLTRREIHLLEAGRRIGIEMQGGDKADFSDLPVAEVAEDRKGTP